MMPDTPDVMEEGRISECTVPQAGP
jgi:hypothetical protein